MSGAGQDLDQGTLELDGLEANRPVGRVERAVRTAIAAAPLIAADAGAAEAACALARGMDQAVTGRQDPYAVAAVGKPLMEQLSRLHLDPEARGAGGVPAGDAWDQLLEEIGQELKGDRRAHAGPSEG